MCGRGRGGRTPDISSDEDAPMGETINLPPKKIPGASNKTPKKSHAVFPSLKNFQKKLNGLTCCTLFGSTIFAELRGRDARALPQIFKLFWIPQKIPAYIQLQVPQKNTCPISFPQKSQNRKFQLNPKYPSIISVTWNPKYPTTPAPHPSPGNKGPLRVSLCLVYWRLTLPWNNC